MGALGYSSITLTDLTETLPVFLMLESNKSNNIQKKNGSLYTPDFERDGVIITPSLFIGSEEQNEILLSYKGEKGLYYKINDAVYYYGKTNSTDGVWVDEDGKLHIKINFPESYEINAYIDSFKNKDSGTEIQVKSRNKISFFVLEESSSYTAIIASNRDHFDENNTDDIILTAQFYKGTLKVTNANYTWDGLTDNDNSTDNSNILGTGETLTLSREQVNGTEVISCTMKDTDTDLSFVATKTIRDYVDEYRADLLPSSSLILTPNNPSVELTARVWHKTNIINNNENQNRFDYKWQLIKVNEGETVDLIEDSSVLKIDTTSTEFPKENFTIACTITIDGKTTASAYQNIAYSPIEYTINIEPRQVWLNVDNNGNYSGKHTFNFRFQLLDKEKNPIPKEESDGIIISSDSHWSITEENEDYWEDTLTLELDAEKDVLGDSNIFEFQYKYLKNDFSEEIYVIKNYAGENGANGASYTVDLSNSFHTFSGSETAATAEEETSFILQTYYGDIGLDIFKIEVDEKILFSSLPSEVENPTFIKNNSLQVSYNAGSKRITLKASPVNSTGGKFLTTGGTITIKITVNNVNNSTDHLTFIKFFNYAINYKNKSYYLSFGDDNTITYSAITGYSPKQIVAKAYSKGAGTEVAEYTGGKIIYSYDKENWTELVGNIITGYVDIKNIYVRLYSDKANLNDLVGSEQYLLDEETIPVLTSLDGVEIGGDNLLRWTKNMPLENNKWSLYSVNSADVDKVYPEQDGDFNSIVIDKSAPWSYIFSPKEKINSEYTNKTFCFSCYVYFDSVPNFISDPILACQLRLYTDFSDILSSDRKFHKQIGELSTRKVDGNNYPTPHFITKEEISAGKWIKVYQIFTWDSFFPKEGITIEPKDCKYFSLALYSGATADDNKRTVKIKKPKLEIGNIPTEWSASPYDISYENINGVNLINGLSSYILTLDKDNNRQIVTNDLDKNQPYVLSWDSCITGGNKFCWALETESENENLEIKYYQNFDGSSNQNNYIYTLFPNLVDENWSLSFYFGQIIENSDKKLVVNYNSSSTKITLNRIKLEKGTVKTPFFLTPEQQTEINNEINENYILIGNQFVELGEDFDTLTGKLNQATVDINRLQGTITTSSEMLTAHADSIRKIENSITIDPGKEPSIVIKTASQDNTQTQAFFLRLTPSKLSFINQNQNEEKELASMSQDTLTITKSNLIESYVEKDFNIGGLNFKITESGVGVIWDIPNKGEKEWRRK